MKRKILFFGAALCAGLVLGLTLAVKSDIFSTAESQNTPLKQNLSAPFKAGLPLEDSVVNVANITGKSVVSISSEFRPQPRKSRGFYFNAPFGGQESPFGNDEFFRRFFDDFFGEMPDSEYRQMGLGSGVIIDPEGYILTNEHVVRGADKITVTLPDGRKFNGELKGQDPRSDLAVIKISSHNLPVAVLGDSDSLRIGEWVVAIGNPFGFAMENPEPTVTVGVIGALHRALGKVVSQDRDYNDMIQTDAAINPGNSGGPLVNLKGEVIGINVAIFSTSGGYQGVGFAIPVNNAKRIISKLIEGKKVVYGWLGVTVQNLSDDLVKYFGLSGKEGVLVAGVLKGGPAEKSGIKSGDVITRFNNVPVNSVKELVSMVGKAPAGKKAKVMLMRDKKQLVLDVVVGERPDSTSDVSFAGAKESGTWRGLIVEDINAQSMGIPAQAGVVVTRVEPGSPADEAGVIPGDVITEINRKPVNNLGDYQKITSAAKGECLVMTSRGYVVIRAK